MYLHNAKVDLEGQCRRSKVKVTRQKNVIFKHFMTGPNVVFIKVRFIKKGRWAHINVKLLHFVLSLHDFKNLLIHYDYPEKR